MIAILRSDPIRIIHQPSGANRHRLPETTARFPVSEPECQRLQAAEIFPNTRQRGRHRRHSGRSAIVANRITAPTRLERSVLGIAPTTPSGHARPHDWS